MAEVNRLEQSGELNNGIEHEPEQVVIPQANFQPDTTNRLEEGRAPVELNLDSLQKLTQQLINEGHKEGVRAILKEFGAPKVSALPTEHYAKFKMRLENLKSSETTTE